MRVFILATGRCGTMTFAKACSHITNYTSGHETHRLHPERFPVYPDNHIEVDSHLSWMLGSLWQQEYHFKGDGVRYVHLWRDPEAVARSWLKRPTAHSTATMMFQLQRPATICDMLRLVDIVDSNIEEFLRGHMHMKINIEQAGARWPKFWREIGAEGDMEAGRKEFTVRYNAS